MHRNTFINSPKHLQPTLQWRGREGLFFAGQMTGVEGYIESAATGLLAGINAALLLEGKPLAVPPATTALGALLRYISEERKSFQPMNVSFGLLPSLHNRLRGREKKAMMARRALADMHAWALETEERDASADALLAGSTHAAAE
jgi:methylenetetrahydrofolate--tRNA-(uracil-5-)-methyltransferase